MDIMSEKEYEERPELISKQIVSKNFIPILIKAGILLIALPLIVVIFEIIPFEEIKKSALLTAVTTLFIFMGLFALVSAIVLKIQCNKRERILNPL